MLQQTFEGLQKKEKKGNNEKKTNHETTEYKTTQINYIRKQNYLQTKKWHIWSHVSRTIYIYIYYYAMNVYNKQ